VAHHTNFEGLNKKNRRGAENAEEEKERISLEIGLTSLRCLDRVVVVCPINFARFVVSDLSLNFKH
jgi:hypothetical protein